MKITFVKLSEDSSLFFCTYKVYTIIQSFLKDDLQITRNVENYKIRFGLLVETSFVTLFLLKGLNLWMRADGPPAVFAKMSALFLPK